MKFVFFLLIFFVPFIGVFCQINLPLNVIAISGDAIENNEIKLEFTVGEPVADLIRNDQFYINQGFQQAHFNNLVLTVPTIELEKGQITVYPNPFRHTIYIENSANYEISKVTIANIIGRSFINISGIQISQQIQTSTLPPGIYWMTVYFANLPHKSIKLIKL